MRSAHRGGAQEQVENTLEAFENAVQNGIKYLEMDVHLTKDKQVVVAHDFDLSRVCILDNTGGKKFIGEFNFNELPPFRPMFLTGVANELQYIHPNN